ncbi:nuclease-related domain-containing protein [Methylobacterium sp. Leaf118]|uniref:nuclease-related domain-containing protein n=1 Tax=Methylobacterium sp. Leaf118 TaxID=2876562 RepID=UPI001E29C37C|nr:nuclease-related domain-containing protein [Methylobacterium sp. Leaf118]
MKIDDKNIIKAVRESNWPRLRDLIEQLGGGHDAIARITDVIRRNGTLVIQAADHRREAAREGLIGEFRRFVASFSKADGVQALDQLISQSALIERGYRAIATALASSQVMRLPADIRLTTMLASFSDIADRLQRAQQADILSGRDVAWQHRRIPLPEGEQVYGDGVISGVADLTLLVMQTDGRDWLDENGDVVVPAVPSSTPINLDDVNELIEFAVGWKLIGRLHDRLRFFDGSIDVANDRDNVTRIVSRPTDIERLDYVANERFHERLQQTFFEMVGQTPLVAQSRGIEQPCPLEPKAFISPQEGHARVMLCEVFCSDITVHSGKPGGLTIMEWLRGYAALQAIVEAGYVPGDARTLLRAFDRDALVGWLRHLGMSEDAGRLFIDRVTYQRGSVDLFDNPIIRRTDESLMINGATALTLDLTRVVLSAIASSGYQQDKKGVAFEKVVRKFFEKHDKTIKRLKFKRDGEEYEIDALLAWGDDVFVIECKNWALSGYNPQRARTFWDRTFEAAHKVKLKATAIKKYPELVKNRTGIDVRGKTMTPIVLHLMPCAMVDAMDGVYVTDWSAVTRFFQEPTLNARLTDVGDEISIPLARQWAGDRPTVEEFKRALASPNPATQAHSRLRTITRRYETTNFEIEFEEIQKAESSFEMTAAAYGFDPDETARLREDGVREMMARRARMGATLTT